MKNPLSLASCHLCKNTIRLSCSCDSKTSKGDEDDKKDNLSIQASDQLLNVKNIPRSCSDSNSVCMNQNRHTPKICLMCEEEIPCENDNSSDEDVQNGNSYDGYCQCCYKFCKDVSSMGLHGNINLMKNIKSKTINGQDINANVPSTSGETNCRHQNGDINSNFEENDGEIDNEDTEFDSLNENGLIRVDMRKIIDPTGLPTYEAALKLESTGYV